MPRTKPSTPSPRKAKPFKQAVTDRGFSYGAMRDAHFRGELAVIRIGRAWYLEDTELERFVDQHTIRHQD